MHSKRVDFRSRARLSDRRIRQAEAEAARRREAEAEAARRREAEAARRREAEAARRREQQVRTHSHIYGTRKSALRACPLISRQHTDACVIHTLLQLL